MTIISEKDLSNPEFLWLHITEAATSEFDDSRYSFAAEKWQNAYQLAQAFNDCDPRIACSLNNIALAFRIKKDFKQATRCYRDALENWESAANWVDRMQLGQRARSSLFHLRMESKHRKKYDNIARRNYKKLLSAGHAGALNNLAELFHSTHQWQNAKQLYAQALQQRISSMGGQERGVTVIRKNIAYLSDATAQLPDATDHSHSQSNAAVSFISQAERQRWVVDRPAEFTDEGRLMAAILLTHLVVHSSLNDAS